MTDCAVVGCPSTDTRRYMNGDYCPAHTPNARAGRPEPPQQDTSWIRRARRTLPSAKGGTDVDKDRPGGYVSRQKAQRIAETRDAIRENGTPND